MRELKFRAWDKSERQMTMAETLPRLMCQDSLPTSWVNDMVFMQYTGLMDKNGVEIYEGDIIRYSSGDERSDCLVEFEEGIFYANAILDLDAGDNLPLCDLSNDYIVIGNIHQNPDLLEPTP